MKSIEVSTTNHALIEKYMVIKIKNDIARIILSFTMPMEEVSNSSYNRKSIISQSNLNNIPSYNG
jgi:hypothetical protein